MDIIFYLKPPKSAKPGDLPSKRLDIDNLAKSVLDALNGLAFKDDNLILDLNLKRGMFLSVNQRQLLRLRPCFRRGLILI